MVNAPKSIDERDKIIHEDHESRACFPRDNLGRVENTSCKAIERNSTEFLSLPQRAITELQPRLSPLVAPSLTRPFTQLLSLLPCPLPLRIQDPPSGCEHLDNTRDPHPHAPVKSAFLVILFFCPLFPTWDACAGTPFTPLFPLGSHFNRDRYTGKRFRFIYITSWNTKYIHMYTMPLENRVTRFG